MRPESVAKRAKAMLGNQFTKGRKQSEEAKAKIAAANIGKGNFKGFKHSPEAKVKIALANKGHTVSDETRRKLRDANLGKPSTRKGQKLSIETKRKLAEAYKAGKMGQRFVKRPFYTANNGDVIQFRSSWELLVAQYMDASGWYWDYEPIILEHDGDVYIPDFAVYDDSDNLIKLIEVKGYYKPDAKQKLIKFQGWLRKQDMHLEVWDEPVLKHMGIL